MMNVSLWSTLVGFENKIAFRMLLTGSPESRHWNKDQIAEGISLRQSVLDSRLFGAYTLWAAIAATHAHASTSESGD
jgi:RNA polymerase sigma-70 factor, ECF subfamily